MKNILLIITLFISWNAIAEEKAWFCVTEKRGGLSYEDGNWELTKFKEIRMTVKQIDNNLRFNPDDAFHNTLGNCVNNFNRSRIVCNDTYDSIFSLDTTTGFATSAYTYGWLGYTFKKNKHADSLVVNAWKCESF